MPDARPAHGRTATLIVLVILLLTVCATVYLYIAQHKLDQTPTGLDPEAEYARIQHLIILITILLISALLILLFVVGAYLLIRVGRLVTRGPLGGKPTAYVNVWQQYRVTDEQITAATQEPPADDKPRREPPDADTPLSDAEPDDTPSET
jgi:hypothetical protein